MGKTIRKPKYNQNKIKDNKIKTEREFRRVSNMVVNKLVKKQIDVEDLDLPDNPYIGRY